MRIRLILAAAFLAMIPLACQQAETPTAPSAGAPSTMVSIDDNHSLGEALVDGSLTAWPVYAAKVPDVGEFLTLAEALESGKAEVKEVGGGQQAAQIVDLGNRIEEMNGSPIREQEEQVYGDPGGGASVGTLVVANHGDLPILICAGTIVTGGQQDRQIGQDLIIAAKAEVPVNAFCVEQGRWANHRMGADTGGNFATAMHFAMPNQRAPAQYEGDQGKVWAGVEATKHKLMNAVSKEVAALEVDELRARGAFQAYQNTIALKETTSLAVVLDAQGEVVGEELQEMVSAVRAHFESGKARGHLVGFAYAIDGKPVNVRVFAHPKIFQKQFDPFLNSLCAEAFIADRSREEGAAPPPPATAEDVVALVHSIRQAEEEVAETAAGNPNGIRRAAAGFNGNCYLPAEGKRGRVALTQDWTSK